MRVKRVQLQDIAPNYNSCKRIGTHCVHVSSASAERFSRSVKTLYSRVRCALDRAECFALEKDIKNSYKVVRQSLVYEASVSVGFKCTKNFVSRDLYTRCGPVCLHVLGTCLFTDTRSYTLTCLKS